jgi:Peptidase C13 family
LSPLKPLINLVKNILAGTRAALFMPIQLWHFKSGYLQICLLLVVSLGLSIAHDYFDTAPDNYFNPYGLSYQALLYLLFFFSLSLVAVFNSRQRDLAKLAVLFLSIVPAIWLVTVCLLALSKQQTYIDEYQSSWAVFIIYSLWYLMVSARLFKRFFYLSYAPTVLYVALYAVINFTPLFLLPTEPLWYPRQANIDQQEEDIANIDIETIYYSQNPLLERLRDDLVEGKEGTPELFFIGFAGDADEDVFMNEAMAAQNIMNNYFDAYGRSLILINNRNTVDNFPLANGHNLKQSIKQIAKLMNRDEDILFLFLTSHGSEDHTLSANFPPFKLNNINATTIKQALDDAEIKWRIIIISACYSGGFIEPLAGPATLLITAASADRNSFGCGHDGKYTYFGDAYFENGLKQTRSFIAAFEQAFEIIRAKEEKEDFKNSEPQISVGVEIKNKLSFFERELEKKRNLNWASAAGS